MNDSAKKQSPSGVVHIPFAVPKQPAYLLPYLNSDVVKLGFEFDIARLRAVTDEVVAKNNLASKERFDTYKGIGLQSADGFDEYFDTMQDLRDLKKKKHNVTGKDFHHLNSLGKHFSFVFKAFEEAGVRLVRARILSALPGHRHEPHFDWDFRIHIPIITNEKCVAIFGNKNYHMKADGGAYLHNGYRLHTFENMGTSDRLHFIAVVDGLTDLHRPANK